MSSTDIATDGLFISRFDHHTATNEFAHTLMQPSDKLIYAQNAELRKNPGALNDMGHGLEGGTWARQVASIPIIDYEQAKLDGYDLDNPDATFATKEMFRFLASDTGKKSLVVNKILTKI